MTVRIGRKRRKRLAQPVVMLCHSCGWIGTPQNVTIGGWALGDRLIQTYACGNPDPDVRCAPLNLSHVRADGSRPARSGQPREKSLPGGAV